MFLKKITTITFVALAVSAALIVSGLFSSKASAAVTDWGGAVNSINSYCGAGYTMAHAAYGSATNLDLNSGKVTFNFNVLWKRCNWNYTGEYAVTGYDGDACPAVGMYHDGYIPTQDCIKYSDRHGETRPQTGVCSPWNGPRCVYAGFDSNVLKGPYGGPPDLNIRSSTIYTRTAYVDNWGVVGKSSNSQDVYVGTICAAHFGKAGSWQNLYCVPAYTHVSWVVSNYALTPSVSGVTDGKIESPSSVPYSVIGAVSNAGPTPSVANTKWQLTRVVYDGAPPAAKKAGSTSSNQNPCQFVGAGPVCISFQNGTSTYGVGNTNSYNGTDTTGNLAMGKQVCYIMSVQPRSSASGDWRHSPMKCVIIAKSPKVNLLGGDLAVTGSGVTRISTALTTNLTAGRQTTYGSWSEYGVMSDGGVRNFASGAGVAGGVGGSVTNVCPAQSQLTFANNRSSGCTLGGYTTEPASDRLQDRFKPYNATLTAGKVINLSEGAPANPTYIGKNAIYGGAASGKLTISGGSLGKGQWVVINAPNMDVEINGDVTYFDGTLNALKDIPQLVIIAKNINISESVGRVDAWLVAAGTGTDGYVSTCYQIPRDVMNRTVAGASTTAHSGSRCTAQLTVNGPVIANHLYLYRTAGSGTEKAAGDPAERFNYRPDAYLWSLGYSSGGSAVPTVSTTELPPRF